MRYVRSRQLMIVRELMLGMAMMGVGFRFRSAWHVDPTLSFDLLLERFDALSQEDGGGG